MNELTIEPNAREVGLDVFLQAVDKQVAAALPEASDEFYAALTDAAGLVAVESREQETAALAIAKRLRNCSKQIAAQVDDLAKIANKVHRTITGHRAKVTQPATDEVSRLERLAGNYRHAVEEAERRRVEAERARLAAERKAAGNTLPDNVAEEVVMTTVQPMQGGSLQERWTAEVVSIVELCRAVAEGKAPVTVVDANVATLNALARTLKGAANVPGVVFTCEHVAATRASR